MSVLSQRIMRGEYVSKAECFDHAEEVDRTMAAYAPAMAAFDEWTRRMEVCTCDYDIDWHDRSVRMPNPACPVEHEEDGDE